MVLSVTSVTSICKCSAKVSFPSSFKSDMFIFLCGIKIDAN
jgi:hypothetical protein